MQAVVPTPRGQDQTELERRRLLLDRLRNEYILSHDNISPALMAGTEQPPADWTNRRLGQLGEKWRIPIGTLSPTEPPPQSHQVEVGLRFVHANRPALIISNLSDSVARNIKWTVLLWNMDLPDRNDPLPIPVSSYDFIRSHAEGGPQNLFDGPLLAPLLKPGDRLFGSASVDCPDCARGRTYVVYIVFGKDGWFSEVLNEKSGGSYIPRNLDKDGREEYFKTLEAGAPEQFRTRIGRK